MNPISFIITSITWAGPRCAQELGDYFKPPKPHSGKLCLLINLIIINTINDCLLYMIFLLSSPIDIENLLPSIECAEVPWRWNELLLRSASGLALAQPGPVTRGHVISLDYTFKLYLLCSEHNHDMHTAHSPRQPHWDDLQLPGPGQPVRAGHECPVVHRTVLVI